MYCIHVPVFEHTCLLSIFTRPEAQPDPIHSSGATSPAGPLGWLYLRAQPISIAKVPTPMVPLPLNLFDSIWTPSFSAALWSQHFLLFCVNLFIPSLTLPLYPSNPRFLMIVFLDSLLLVKGFGTFLNFQLLSTDAGLLLLAQSARDATGSTQVACFTFRCLTFTLWVRSPGTD